MNFDLTEEQDIIRGLAMQIFDGQATTERVKAAEAGDGFDRALYASLAEANLLGLCLPERDGGSGKGLVELALLAEQQGRRVAPVPLVATIVTAITIAAHGSDGLRSTFLPGVIDGSVVLTSALAEPGANDLTTPSARATPVDGGYRITGHRPAVPYAQHAARVLVPARLTDGDVALFVVDPGAAGVEVTAADSTDHQPMAHLALDTFVTGSARLGDAAAIADLQRRWMVALCGVHLGVAQGSLAATADHVGARQQFGRPLAGFQAVGQRIADAYITTEALRVTTFNAAWRLDEGLPADRDVLVAAYWAAEGGQQVTLAGQHLHGGIGADVDYPVHRYFLWSSQLANTLGSASSHLARLGGSIAAGPEGA